MSKVGVKDVGTIDEESVKTLKFPEEEIKCKKRIPKRIIHFSDGTLEEYSSDEEDSTDSSTATAGPLLEANITHLRWMPWFWYQTVLVGSKALAVFDYLGESLANFFGIISPKYEYEIDQYKRALAEEEEKRKQDAELGSLCTGNTSTTQLPIQTEPLRY